MSCGLMKQKKKLGFAKEKKLGKSNDLNQNCVDKNFRNPLTLQLCKDYEVT